MKRRTFCIASSVSLFGTAGCMDTVFEKGLRLGGVVLTNRRDSSVVIHLQVKQGDTIVVDNQYSLAASDRPDSGASLDDVWDDHVAQYTVTVSIDSGMSDSFTYTAHQRDGDCTVAFIEIRPSTIAFASHEDLDGTYCSRTSD